jgi:hypothetical protein
MTIKLPIPADKAAVDTILGFAELAIVDDDYDRLVRAYPLYRAQAAALRIPEARYALPADIYPVLRCTARSLASKATIT